MGRSTHRQRAATSALACYAARAVHSGRRVCGHEKVRDVLSPVARRRHGFRCGAVSSKDVVEDTAIDVRQPVVPSCVPIRQLGVIDSH